MIVAITIGSSGEIRDGTNLPSVSGVASPRRRATVLVVEDDLSLREFYRTALKTGGFEAVGVEDGIDALRWLELHAPDVIVLDLGLVRVHGRDVHRELRADAETRKIPVVVVTGGNAHDIDKTEVACILLKPVTADTLVEAVENCLRRR